MKARVKSKEFILRQEDDWTHKFEEFVKAKEGLVIDLWGELFDAEFRIADRDRSHGISYIRVDLVDILNGSEDIREGHSFCFYCSSKYEGNVVKCPNCTSSLLPKYYPSKVESTLEHFNVSSCYDGF